MKLRADFDDGTVIEMECPMTECVETMEAFRERVRDHVLPALGPVVLVVNGLHTAFDAAGNRKIDAIKIVRSAAGFGLREAKDFVDAACDGGVRSDQLTMERINTALKAHGMTSRFRPVD